MLQVVKRWKVAVLFADGKDVTIWVSDNFLSNVLRTVASLDFSEKGQPFGVNINEAPPPTNAATVTTASS